MRRLLSVAVSVATLGSAGLLAVSSAPVQAKPASASCHGIRVQGTLESGRTIEKHWVVGAYIHAHDKPLASGLSGGKGGYTLCVPRTGAAKKYAGSHSGHLDIDVVGHKKNGSGHWLIRTVDPRLSQGSATPSKHFVTMHTIRTTVNAKPIGGHGFIRTGDPVVNDYVLHPAVMYLEQVKYETTSWKLSAKSDFEATAKVGVGTDDWGTSGSITVGHSHGFDTGSGTIHLKNGQTKRAVLLEPDARANSVYDCYDVPTLMAATQICGTTTAVEWTGLVQNTPTPFKNCFDGRFWALVTNWDTGWYEADDGVKFVDKAGLKTPIMSASLQTTYDDDTGFKYRLDQSGPTHDFCIGGDGTTLTNSSELYILNEDPVAPSKGPKPVSFSIPRELR
jgi:hypothetical protein